MTTTADRMIVRIIGDARSYLFALNQVRAETVAAVVAIQAAFQSLNLAAQLQQTQALFSSLIGDAQAGKRLVMELQQMAATTPVTTSALQNAARTLLQFGVRANEVTGLLRILGNITAGDSERMGRLALAFGQMRTAGKLMGQDLLQMINAGFNPLKVISQRTGRDITALREDMRRGAITADMVTEAFREVGGEGGRLGNVLQDMSKTTLGALRNLTANLEILGQRLGAVVSEALGLGQILSNVTDVVRGFGEVVESPRSNFLGQLLTELGMGFRFVHDIIRDSVETIQRILNETSGIERLFLAFRTGLAIPAAIVGVLRAIGEWFSSTIPFVRELILLISRFASIFIVSFFGIRGAVIAVTFTITTLRSAIFALSAAIVANPVTAWAVAIGVAVSILVTLGSTISQTTEEARQLNEQLQRRVQGSSDFAGRIEGRANAAMAQAGNTENLDQRRAILTQALEEARMAARSLAAEVQGLEAHAQRLEPTWRSLWLAGRNDFERAQQDLEATRQAMNRATQAAGQLHEAINQIGPNAEQRRLQEDFRSFIQGIFGQALNMGRSREEIQLQELALRGLTEAQKREAEAALNVLKIEKERHALRKSVEDLTKSLAEQAATAHLVGAEAEIMKLQIRGATEAQLKQARAHARTIAEAKAHQEMLKRATEITKQFRTPQEILNDTVAELDMLLSKDAISLDTYNRALADAEEKANKLNKSLKGTADRMRDVARFGSAEAISRFMEFRDRLTEQREALQNRIRPQRPDRGFGPDRGAPGFGANPRVGEPERPNREPAANQGRQQVALLEDIRDILRDEAAQPGLELDFANV